MDTSSGVGSSGGRRGWEVAAVASSRLSRTAATTSRHDGSGPQAATVTIGIGQQRQSTTLAGRRRPPGATGSGGARHKIQ
jgi:hypothetical protein